MAYGVVVNAYVRVLGGAFCDYVTYGFGLTLVYPQLAFISLTVLALAGLE